MMAGTQATSCILLADAPDISDQQLHKILLGLDTSVGKIVETLPVNALLIVFTCQGDTAEYRRMQVCPSASCLLLPKCP